MKAFPCLYKKTSTGATQYWKINVIEANFLPTIETIFGQHGTDKPQTTQDTISKGKNIGKKNETTAIQQAEAEALAKWQKQKKSGYVESIADAEAGKVDDLIEGGIVPMLAHKFSEQGHKIKYSALTQPKLDGCLKGETKLETNLGIKTIKEIVDNKIKCDVLSWDESSNKPEMKPIVGWFNNGELGFKHWKYIKFSNGHVVKCTENHKLLTQSGWKRADELNSRTDKLLCDRGSDRQFSLILGTLLGDSCGSLEKRGNSKSFRFNFNHAKEDLGDFKKHILGLKMKKTTAASGFGSNMFRYTSETLSGINFPAEKMFYFQNNIKKGKRKLINHRFLVKYLSDEGLSMWIADDGSLSFNNFNKLTPLLHLHTQGFPKEQIHQFVLFFKKRYGCIPQLHRDKKVINGSGLFLTFSSKDTLFILNRLRKFHIKGAEYKYYFPTEAYIEPVKGEFKWYSFKIANSRRNVPSIRYDIEVSENHNYFANKTLVHNCRAISVIKNGKCTLWSRTRKPIYSVPSIVAQVEALNLSDCVLDGELYNHEYRNNFEKIVSLVRQEKPDAEHAIVQYHIYDCADSTRTFKDRIGWLQTLRPKLENRPNLKLVQTEWVQNEEEAMEWFEKFKAQGYEGSMLRNADGKYANKRSYDLQKVKDMIDDEFAIVGIEEGRGKLAGHVGAFQCRTKNGNTFSAKMSGDTDKLRDYFLNHKLWGGKLLNVQYQGLTSYGLPRFPIGIYIRDFE